MTLLIALLTIAGIITSPATCHTVTADSVVVYEDGSYIYTPGDDSIFCIEASGDGLRWVQASGDGYTVTTWNGGDFPANVTTQAGRLAQPERLPQ